LIVEEVLVNIIRHGYAHDSSQTIDIQVAWSPAFLQMTFEDRGKPFDPLTEIAVNDLAWGETGRAEGGFGFPLVRALSEKREYRYQEGKNILVIFQSLPTSSA
jgi:anti-sigma regulatory factor (Ser/Thr protein kinase)